MRTLLERLTLAVLLLVQLPAYARDTQEHWVEVKSPHFVVLTDTNEKQARHVATELEQMRSVFHVILPAAADTAGSPIVVLALRDKKAFQALEPAAYLAKGQLDLAGYFLRAPDKNYILLRLDANGSHPLATVYHEYTHYMMRNASEWIPLWLNEGLAEFYQNTEIRDKEVMLGEPSPDDILYLRQNRLMPLATLLAVDQTSPYYHEEQKGSVFYAQSWALTHYIEITDRQKGTTHLEEYARLLMKKEDPVRAAQQVFGDLTLLQKALATYIAQDRFMEFKMTQGVSVDEAGFTEGPLPTADADAIRADVLVYNGRIADAQALIDTILRDDPKNALAHESMGFLKFREGDLTAARKWYGEAVELDSQSYLAHYYFAVMSLQTDGNRSSAVEASLRAAIKLNPHFAPAYDTLAMFDSTDPAKAGEAHAMNLQAVSLEPDNLTYRINTATVLAENKRFDDAVRVLEAARHVAKTPEDVARVEVSLRSVAQYKASDAESRTPFENSAGRQEPAALVGTTTVTDTRTMTVTSSDGRVYRVRPDAADEKPKYPTEPPTGARHTAVGIVRDVHCSYPKVLTMAVDQSPKGVAVSLYRNDFYQIEFTVTNFTPKSDINPCTDISGLKAKVEYAEVSDKSVAGQILSVELSK